MDKVNHFHFRHPSNNAIYVAAIPANTTWWIYNYVETSFRRNNYVSITYPVCWDHPNTKFLISFLFLIYECIKYIHRMHSFLWPISGNSDLNGSSSVCLVWWRRVVFCVYILQSSILLHYYACRFFALVSHLVVSEFPHSIDADLTSSGLSHINDYYYLTHCDPVMPYGDINLRQHRLR